MAYMTDEGGNYKRTVRCGHCYEKGHNKSSCKQLRQRLRDRIAKYKTALERDVWSYDWEKDSAQRHLQAAARQLHKLEGKGKTRKCGYCSGEGHTRRTCTERKDHLQSHTEKTLKVRRELCDRFISLGLGPGALVEVETREFASN